jgi:hypothetical protein
MINQIITKYTEGVVHWAIPLVLGNLANEFSGLYESPKLKKKKNGLES